MAINVDEQLVAEACRWLRGFAADDVREDCRKALNDWLSSGDTDAECVAAVRRLWCDLLKGS